MEFLLAFAGVAFVLTVTPGLDTAMVLRTAALDGRRAGIFAAIGIGMGCLCWGAAVALGLGALLAASPLAFTVLKWAGASYMVFAGTKLLLSLRHGPAPTVASDPVEKIGSARAALRRGFATNILNPKVGIFYLTLLPQFVPTGAPAGAALLLLACLHVAFALSWFVALASAVAKVGPVLRAPRVARLLNGATGGIFCGFGAQLVLVRA